MMQHRTRAPDDCTRTDGEFGEIEAHHPEAQEALRSDVARLPGIAAQLIGERMRAMYATIVSEPVPEELLDLIRKLESRERSE